MKCALTFTLLAAAICSSWAAPLDLNDLFLGLSRPAAVDQQPEQDVVKRQVLANPDGQLKQVSFQALIGDLENSLFQSALSVHGASAPGAEVVEVRPGQAEAAESDEHSITKRSDEPTAATASLADSDGPQERKILVQTTKKVPQSEEGVPAHLIIDRVSVLPHSGVSVPLIPTFQVHHTKITSATIKEDANNDSSDGKQTKISITKTSITSTAPVEALETPATSTSAGTSAKPEVVSTTEKPSSSEEISSSATPIASTTSSGTTADSTTSGSSTVTIISSSTTTSTTTSTAGSTTTEAEPIVKLKQDEEKLKAKVAEVEAEPVILTARV